MVGLLLLVSHISGAGPTVRDRIVKNPDLVDDAHEHTFDASDIYRLRLPPRPFPTVAANSGAAASAAAAAGLPVRAAAAPTAATTSTTAVPLAAP